MNVSKQILRIAEVTTRTGLGRASIYAMSARNEFPKQIRLGARASGWVASEVDEWIEQRISARDGKAA